MFAAARIGGRSTVSVVARRPAPCPCGTGETLAACCGRYLTGGDATPPTAERLMRSRYTAFALGDMDHLAGSWHRSTRPIALRDDPDTRWTGLDVLATTGGGLFDGEGTVEFRAHFRTKREHDRPTDGPEQVLAENSRFVREDGRWWYVEPV